MTRDEDECALEILLASDATPLQEPQPYRLPVLRFLAVIFASAIGFIVLGAALLRLLYWLFPVPWDLLRWLLGY